jgi:hypothetical protein
VKSCCLFMLPVHSDGCDVLVNKTEILKTSLTINYFRKHFLSLHYYVSNSFK